VVQPAIRGLAATGGRGGWWTSYVHDQAAFTEALLTSLDADSLTALLAVRPDLASPEPHSLKALVNRSLTAQSLMGCLRRLSRFQMQVAQTLVLLSRCAAAGWPPPVEVSGLAELIGAPITEADVELAIRALESLALVRREPPPPPEPEAEPEAEADRRLLVHPMLATMGTPVSLGRPAEVLLRSLSVEELRTIARALDLTVGGPVTKADLVKFVATRLSDPDAVRERLANAPKDAAAAAREAATDRPQVRHQFWDVHRAARSGYENPVLWLSRHGFLVADSPYTCEMPREVALAIRGGRLFPRISASPPPLELDDRFPAPTEAEVAETAARLIEAIEGIVTQLSARPAPRLKSGGIGVREVRRLAQGIGVPQDRAAELLEYAAMAGLVQIEGALDELGQASPTPNFDAWLDMDPAERWLAVARAWLSSDVLASVSGATDVDNKMIPALSGMFSCDGSAMYRQAVLSVLASVAPPNSASVPSLVETALWHLPFLANRLDLGPGAHTQAVLAESAHLGLAEGTMLTPLGRCLAEQDFDGCVEWLSARLRLEATGLLLQADLTAVVAGKAAHRFRERLELISTTESKGGASVYRFSETSIRRGLDAGLDAPAIVAWLRDHSSTPVPQPLEYLIGDVARRYGNVRVGTSRSFVRSEDPALLAEVLRHKKTARLRLRQIAPTVLVSNADAETLLASLHAAGYLAAEESGGGELVVKTPSRHRTRAAGGGAGALVTPPHLAGQRDGELGRLARRLVDPVSSPEPLLGASSFADPRNPNRPNAIARDPETIGVLAATACVKEWAVRMSYLEGTMREASGWILAFDEDTVDFANMDDEHSDGMTYLNISDIAWLRVLTEAEEEALL
jgi:hypothetical protein